MAEKLTPMMKQYRRVKGEVEPGVILFFRLGDFYEMFFDDAVAAAQKDQKDFLAEHLGMWFPQFTKRVKSRSTHAFYSLVIDSAFHFLRSEIDYLHLRQSD